MKRLLCIVGGMNAGGAETFLMKMYRKLDRSKYQMDFAVTISSECFYDNEILSMGGKIYKITAKSKNPIKNFNDIKKIVLDNKYDSVLRTSEHSLSALELLAAKQSGARIRIFRSSNSKATIGLKPSKLLHKLCAFMPKKFANVKFAPSTEAATFMFGKKVIENGEVFILHNGVDLNVFRFDKTARTEIREEFGLRNEQLLVGHIGRFMTQKNHAFLLEIFKQIAQKNENAVLMLVGKGELEAEIKEKIQTLGLDDKVIFTGVRSDVPKLLSAMDVFVFPSFYEGMPNTVIEAQATGLPCVIADTITKEADITGLVQYLPLSLSAEDWADRALKSVTEERKDTKQDFIEHKYDVESVLKEFVSLVFQEQK